VPTGPSVTEIDPVDRDQHIKTDEIAVCGLDEFLAVFGEDIDQAIFGFLLISVSAAVDDSYELPQRGGRFETVVEGAIDGFVGLVGHSIHIRWVTSVEGSYVGFSTSWSDGMDCSS
jgi:hypothetical protein